MKRFQRFCAAVAAGCLTLLILVGGIPVATQAQESSSGQIVQALLDSRGFKEAEDLGVAASQAVSTSAVFAEYNGTTYVYSTANGGMFNVINAETNRLEYSQQLGDVSQVWTHAAAPNGKVYISGLGTGNVGELWIYNPAAQKAERAGVLLAGHQAWCSTTDTESNLYVGTFQEGNAHVVKYEAATGKIVDLGKVDTQDNSGYVRSIAYHDGALYLGMGVMAKIMRMDLATGQVTDITGNVPTLVGKAQSQLKFAYNMAVAGSYLLVRVDADYEDALVFYNLTTRKWSDTVLKKAGEDTYGAWGFTQLAVDGNSTYVIYNRKLLRIDLSTLASEDTGVSYATALRGAWLQEKDGKKYVLTVNRAGSICWLDLKAGTSEAKDSAMLAAPLQLHDLGLGNNNKLYMTTYPGGPKGSEYDPVTNTFRMYNQGQAEGMIAGDGSTMYFGIYPGAVIQKMDTDTGALTNLFNLKDTYSQDRPYIMKYEDGKLLIGTIPDYQKLGGALAIYDPQTDSFTAYRNVVQDQSIVGLASKDGLIYGSTSIRGGLDVTPTATEPKMFIWDMETGVKIDEFSLDIPGLNTPMISGLTFDKDGNLWGAADGILFTYDVETRTVSHYENLYPSVSGRGMWRPVHILFGDDGLLYTDIAGKLTVVDPDTEHWDFVTLHTGDSEVDFIQLAYDADGHQNVYYLDSGATHLKMIPVIDGGVLQIPPKTVNIPIEVENPSFEKYSLELAGWTPLTGDASEKLSDEQASDGEYSLYAEAAEEPSGFVSALTAVQSGVNCTASAKVYALLGSAQLVLQFLDGNEEVISEQAVDSADTFGEWQTVTVSKQSPENAVYLRLVAKCLPGGKAYFDEFSVSSAAKIVTGNLLSNGDFEDGVTGWTVTQQNIPESAYCEISTEQVKSGAQSLKFVDGGNPASCYLVSDTLTNITPGQAYRLTFSVYNDAAGVNGSPSRCSAFVRYYSASDAQLGEAVKHISGTGSWQDITIDSTAPAGTAYAKVWIGLSPYYVTSGSYFDAMSFAANLAGTSPDEVMLSLPNASCEDNQTIIPGWNQFGQFSEVAYYTISNERADDGDVSLKFYDQSQSDTVFIMSDPISLPDGIERCTASARLYLPDGGCSFLIRFYDENGKQVGSDKDGVNIIPVTVPTPEWQTVQTSLEIPAEAVSAVIGLGVSRAHMTTGACFDSVSLSYPVELFTVSVENGSGSGDYQVGEQVEIQADKAPDGMVFDHWLVIGSGSVADNESASTSFYVEGHAVVRAVYREESVGDETSSETSSKPAETEIPATGGGFPLLLFVTILGISASMLIVTVSKRQPQKEDQE